MRDSRYSLRTRGGSTNTMKEITRSQVGFLPLLFFSLIYSIIKYVESCLPLPAVGLNQFSDMTFSEFRKSFLWSEPQVMAFHTGSSVGPTQMFVMFQGSEPGQLFYIVYCLLQNCSATKGNYLSSNGPYPDSIDWRKKGNYVTDVKNQVKFNCTMVHTHFIDLKGHSTVHCCFQHSKLKEFLVITDDSGHNCQ